MLTEIDHFFIGKPEPQQSCLLYLRSCIKALDEQIVETWKWNLPCYTYKEKMLCYLWLDKKTAHPYIGVSKGNEIEHPLLIKGNRKKIKALYIDPNEDLNIEAIKTILMQAIALY